MTETDVEYFKGLWPKLMLFFMTIINFIIHSCIWLHMVTIMKTFHEYLTSINSNSTEFFPFIFIGTLLSKDHST